MAGNIEKGEASTPLGERLKIRLDENLDVLFAGMDLDTDSLVAEVDVVASPVLSVRDRRRHRAPSSTAARKLPQGGSLDRLRASRPDPGLVRRISDRQGVEYPVGKECAMEAALLGRATTAKI